MLVTFLKEDFKFCDDRGELIQLVHNGYRQINYIKLNTEAFFVISGSFTLEVFKLGSQEKKIYEIKPGDFFCIHPEVTHSFSFTEDTQMISMYSLGVELENGKKDILSINQLM